MTLSYTSVESLEDESPGGEQQEKASFSLGISFWLLGLFNNSAYCIMLASAKTISEGGTALVFLANIIPGMIIKLTAPYWFDRVSYGVRMRLAFCFMISSFALVAALADLSKSKMTVPLQLVGVALGSAQGGLGEASLLAAAGKCDVTGKGNFIGWFASGTGFAGVFGFLWKFVWNEWFRLSMSTTLWLAQSLALLYIGIFWMFLRPHLEHNTHHHYAQTAVDEQPLELMPFQNTFNKITATDKMTSSGNEYEDPLATLTSVEETNITNEPTPVGGMTILERTRLVLALWPYIIPLFVVYATEYSLQAGTWTTIGFPVTSEQARAEFYEYSNWMYQAGVFVSRSSGSLGTVPLSLLWLMPTLQAVNVGFFASVAAKHFWYSYAMLLPVCFYVGLLGGAVYVHGYMRICADFSKVDRREFALAATSVAESLGIVCADILGLFIQSCLYQKNNIEGALVSCPIPGRRLR